MHSRPDHSVRHSPTPLLSFPLLCLCLLILPNILLHVCLPVVCLPHQKGSSAWVESLVCPLLSPQCLEVQAGHIAAVLQCLLEQMNGCGAPADRERHVPPGRAMDRVRAVQGDLGMSRGYLAEA